MPQQRAANEKAALSLLRMSKQNTELLMEWYLPTNCCAPRGRKRSHTPQTPDPVLARQTPRTCQTGRTSPRSTSEISHWTFTRPILKPLWDAAKENAQFSWERIARLQMQCHYSSGEGAPSIVRCWWNDLYWRVLIEPLHMYSNRVWWFHRYRLGTVV